MGHEGGGGGGEDNTDSGPVAWNGKESERKNAETKEESGEHIDIRHDAPFDYEGVSLEYKWSVLLLKSGESVGNVQMCASALGRSYR